MSTTYTVKTLTNYGTFNSTVDVPDGAVLSLVKVTDRIRTALVTAAQEQGLADMPALFVNKHIVTEVPPVCGCGGTHADRTCPFRD